ncbi:MAG: hypothetical protein U1E10_03430, partial [Bdellovibrionales bacterium]|nr:hypothetical protein [Bdellovibrionales bacterium]
TCFCTPLFAARTVGRFTVGGYLATEKFAEADQFVGSRNDVQTASVRSFLKVTELADRDDSLIVDLRDKHDFFDKVDKEQLLLSDSNQFQARQLSYGNDGNGFGYRIGRFPLYDAGAVNVDGVSAQYKTDRWNAFAFGGLNPLEYGKPYLVFRPNAQILGAGFSLVPDDLGSRARYSSSTAVVQESFSGEVDRQFIYQRFDWHFRPGQLLYSNFYIDTVPKTQLQNGLFYIDSMWTPRVRTKFAATVIDTVQYVRRQDVRELLPTSTYNEARGEVKYLSEAGNDYSFEVLSGSRGFDGKNRTLAEFSSRWAQIGERNNWDLVASLRAGKNFESQDIGARVGVGFFSRRWEFTADQSYAVETYSDKSYHPLITTISAGRFFSRELLGTASFERIADERVEILAFFFRLTYRYGTKGLAPVRDGSPPRGSL